MKKLIALALTWVSVFGYAQEVRTNEKDIILKSINDETDWSKVTTDLSGRYGQKNADSIILDIKLEYYWNKKKYSQYVKEFVKHTEINLPKYTPSDKNDAAWRVFDYASDKADLSTAFDWISQAQHASPKNQYFLDTYANIQYKLGKANSALITQAAAVKISEFSPNFIETYFRMKAGLPTWKFPVSPTARDEKAEEQIWSSIQKEFSREIDSLMWNSRLKDSKSFEDRTRRARVLMAYIKEFNPKRTSFNLNEHAWILFECANKKSELKTALQWSKESLKDVNAKNRYQFLDTYANLLLKLGRQKDAIKWSEQALALAPENKKTAYKAALKKIIKGE